MTCRVLSRSLSFWLPLLALVSPACAPDEGPASERSAQSKVGTFLEITEDARTGVPGRKCFAIEGESSRWSDRLAALQDRDKPEVERRCKLYQNKVVCKLYSVCKGDTVQLLENSSAVLREPYQKVRYMVFSDCGEPFFAEGWLYAWDYAMTPRETGIVLTHRRYGMVLPFVRSDDPALEGAMGGVAWKGLWQSKESLPRWFVPLGAGNAAKVTRGHALRGYSCQNVRARPSSSSRVEDCLPQGHDLEVLARTPAEGGCWYKVRYATRKGTLVQQKQAYVLQAVVRDGADAWEAEPRHLEWERQLYYLAPPPPVLTLPGCTTNEQCPLDEIGHGQFCRKPDGQCGGSGTCVPLPWDCSPIPEGPTVVGCDGRCYADPCYAFIQGVNVQRVQACVAP
ncbi:MAG: SH3 domain-containing protein [Deltaproteobacteria bacterium]|nr:SH3 domain-containing protein [Deltaproteobacteria bacterium]